MAKELERAGLPTVQVSTMTPVAVMVGANRIVPAAGIIHPLGNADLYQDLPRQLAEARDLGGHPLEFYRRVGFTIVGVLPDANGPGRPDIFLAKRVAHPSNPQSG